MNLSQLQWTLTGYMPNCMGHHLFSATPFGPMKANVPGSVQKTLLENNLIKNWNYGENSLTSEWVENRHWAYKASLPDSWFTADNLFRITFKGLDDNGKIYINGKLVGNFNNSFIPYSFDIKPFLKSQGNELIVYFEEPPRFLGVMGWTSKIKDFKSRFYYNWDWIKRIVQIGIWDDIIIESIPKVEFSEIESLQILPRADKEKIKDHYILKQLTKTVSFQKMM